MEEIKTSKVRTYEELLMDRISKAFIAKDEGDDYLFDEILDEVEMLFKLRPDVYPDFSNVKKRLEILVKQNLQKVNMEIATINDEILKELYKSQKTAIIKWEYRSDMLENILHILNNYQMIPYSNPLIGEMGYGDLEEEMLEDEGEEAIFEQDEPTPPGPPVQPQPKSRPIPKQFQESTQQGQPEFPQRKPEYSGKHIKRKPTYPDR